MTTALEGKPSEFVKKKTPLNPDNYKPRLWVNYSRMTFVNKRSQERLTIDVNLHYLDNTTKVDYDQLVIAEVKQGSARDRSPFIKVMKDYHIAERSISKYCLGVISLNPTIKHNRFKQTILYLKKLLKNERPVLQPISV